MRGVTDVDLAEEERYFDAQHGLDEAPPHLLGEPRRDDLPLGRQLAARLLHGDDALADLPQPMPLVDGLLDRDTTVALYGPSGAGKSFVALDLALSVAAGMPWHGHHVVAGKVLVVLAEGAAGTAPRVVAWKAQHDLAPVANVSWLPQAVNLFDERQRSAMLELVEIVRPDYLIFDTLARCIVGADENSARDMGRIVDTLDRIRRTTGACVMAVHHTGKSIDAGLRGSSALFGALDTVLRLEGADGYLTLTVEKQKHRADGDVLRFRLLPVADSLVVGPHSGLLDPNQLPRDAIAMLVALDELDLGAGVGATNWRRGSNIADRTFYRHLKRLQSLGFTANVGSEKRPLWTLLERGKQLVYCQGAKELPPTATAASAPDAATLPPPFRGGSSGSDTQNETLA